METGLSFGAIVSEASRLSDAMIVAGIDAIAKLAPCHKDNDVSAALLPAFVDSRQVAKKVATAVALKARDEGLSRAKQLEGKSEEEIERVVEERMWEPKYCALEYEPKK